MLSLSRTIAFLTSVGRATTLTIVIVLLSLDGKAEPPKTIDMVLTSGVRPSEYWKKEDSVPLASEGAWHVALGVLSLRALDNCSHEVLLSANGNLEFFDVSAITATSGQGWPAKRSDWTQIVKNLWAAGKVAPMKSVKLSPGPTPQEVGYIVRMAEPGPSHSSAEMIIAIPGAEPEMLPITMEVSEAQPFWRDPVFATLFGAFSGAAIGFGVFVLQQTYSRKAEARKRFEERKIEKATQLWNFFQVTYPPLVNDASLSELERIRNVRKTLLDESIYPLLPLDVANRLNRLSDANSKLSPHISDMDALLRSTFAEFMS